MANAGFKPPPPPNHPDANGAATNGVEPLGSNVRARNLSQTLEHLRAYACDVHKDVDMLLSGVVLAALELTQANGSALALRSSGAVVCRASAGETAPPVGCQLDPNSGLSGECLRTGTAQLCSDVIGDSRVDTEACRDLGIHSMAAVPLRDETGVLGILEVFAARPNAFTGAHIAVLKQLAGVAVLGRGKAEVPLLVSSSRDYVLSVDRIDSVVDDESSQRGGLQSNEPTTSDLRDEKGLATAGTAELDEPIRFTEPAIVASSILIDSRVEGSLEPALPGENSRILKIATVVGLAAVLLTGGWIALRVFRTRSVTVTTGTAANEKSVPADSRNVVSPSAPAQGASSSNNLTVVSGKPSPTLGPAAKDVIMRASNNAPLRRNTPLQVIPGQTSGSPIASSPVASEEASPPTVAQIFPPTSSSATVPASIVVSSTPLPLRSAAVSEGVTGGRLLHQVTPLYPPRAVDEKVSGAVVLQAIVTEDGSVHNVQVISGDPRLSSAAQQAVAQWRYSPFQLNGKPVSMRTNITVQFRLPD